MKHKTELIICVSVFLFILTVIDIAFLKSLREHIEMNGNTFITAGMMEYINPVDHRVLYIPIYEKVKNK